MNNNNNKGKEQEENPLEGLYFYLLNSILDRLQSYSWGNSNIDKKCC